MTTHYHTVIIGGGQCGLAASYWLTRRGVDHIVLEQARAAGFWHTTWDSFALNTPNDWTLQMPGMPYAGNDPDGFAGRDEIIAYFEEHLLRFPPPLVAARATRVATASGGGFRVETSDNAYHTENVVIAIGGRLRHIPSSAARFSGRLLQLHSEEYRRPAALPAGGVLVVGSGSSGCQIAEDVRAAGREVYLSVGGSGRTPRHYRGLDINLWLVLGALDDFFARQRWRINLTGKPGTRDWRVYLTGTHGMRDLDLRDLARDGIRLLGRIGAVDGERINLQADLHASLADADAFDADVRRSIDAFVAATGHAAPPAPIAGPPVPLDIPEVATLDLQRAGVASVIWCTGYVRDYSWIDLPAFDTAGTPLHERGITSIPGVYFSGLQRGSHFRSTLMHGVDREAQHIVAHMLGEGDPSPSTSAPIPTIEADCLRRDSMTT